jgi:pre-mRNA-splicing factor CDC5/CEF1
LNLTCYLIFQARAGKLWSQVQDTFKQMDTAATELECFQELQKQEQMAATYRVRNLTEEVNKQKALECTLQRRYGDLLSRYQRIQEQLEERRSQLKIQEAIEAENRAQDVTAQNHAGREENEVNVNVEEEKGQMTSVIHEEPAVSKQINDQMDMDNSNVDGELVCPNPPSPEHAEEINGEDPVQENSSITQSGDARAGNLEDDKNKLPTVGAVINEGETTLSSDQAIKNEDNGMVPE